MKPYLVRIERTETHETTVEVWAEGPEDAKLTARNLAGELPGSWTKTNEETAVDVEPKTP